MAAKTLKVEIVGDASSLERAFGKAAGQTESFGAKVAKGAKVASAALLGGLAVAAKAGFDELAEGQKVAAQTDAVLSSTGGAANVTAGQIEKLAGKLSKLSGVDDEAIQSRSSVSQKDDDT